jgi:hypothetical protein
VSRRYSRTQFLKDAAWLGLPPDAPISRVELRRRRDRLMGVHHPDRGGDAKKAARINATYARMVDWLDSRSASEVERKGAGAPSATDQAESGSVYKSGLSAAFHAGATYFAAAALIALATYAAFRGNKKP